MKTTLIIFGLLFVVSTAALADIRPPSRPTPKPSKDIDGKIYIDLRSDVKVPTLSIRREALKQLRAAIDEADDAENNVASLEGAPSQSLRTQTIASGLLFSLAFVFGGIWLFRNPGKISKGAVSAIAVVSIGFAAMVVFANSPPPRVVGLTTRIFDRSTKAFGYASGSVKIRILDRTPGVFTGRDDKDVILEIPDGGESRERE
jgi:hypothetical protein